MSGPTDLRGLGGLGGPGPSGGPAAKRTLLVVVTADPARLDEALRAALGLTLRGAAVEVWLDPARPLPATAARAVAVLQSFGHAVRPPGSAAELAAATAVEVWT